MRPSEAYKRDWPMYYSGTWMKHDTLGIGQVNTDENELMFKPLGGHWQEVEPDSLDVWFPRAGAYNNNGCAVYVSRRAVRNMRKSAHPREHYNVKWGQPPRQLMPIMASGPNYLSPQEAERLFERGMATSCAISRDIILEKTEDLSVHKVLFRGLPAGRLEHMEYVPDYDGCPLSKRVAYKLAREVMDGLE